MKKFLASLFPDWINDKGKHAIVGTLIYLGVWYAFGSLAAILFTVAVAGLVELYDYVSKKGTPELLDFLATVAIPTTLYIIWHI